ncbi:MAG: nucleotide exchange factor GrpE [Lentisphaeria bacterium]
MGKRKKQQKEEATEKQPSVISENQEDEEAEKAAEEAVSEAENELEGLKKRLNDAEDKFVRSRAELENYRKRAQRETAEMREYSKVNTVEQFLPVFDHFQMAMMHVGENSDFETLKQGMDMILAEFRRTFDALGVEEVEAEGEKFDPNVHEAMSQEPSDEVPAGHVIRQWKCGYRMGERLLRPATVVVSCGPQEESKAENENDTEKTE